MRIATWNLKRARPENWKSTPRLQAMMPEVAPAVWVLTESHPAVSPGPEYDLTAVSGDAADRPDGECWVAIWVRAGLTVQPLHLEGEPERTAAVLVERSGGRRLLVIGTVLPWRADDRRAPLSGGDSFCEALAAQATDWKRLRAAYPDAELCVAGDFNLEFGHRLWAGTRAGRKALDDLLVAHELSCVTGGDSDLRAQNGWGASVDHVLLSSGLRVRPDDGVGIWPDVHPLPPSLTDHYGVWVELDGSC